MNVHDYINMQSDRCDDQPINIDVIKNMISRVPEQLKEIEKGYRAQISVNQTLFYMLKYLMRGDVSFSRDESQNTDVEGTPTTGGTSTKKASIALGHVHERVLDEPQLPVQSSNASELSLDQNLDSYSKLATASQVQRPARQARISKAYTLPNITIHEVKPRRRFTASNSSSRLRKLHPVDEKSDMSLSNGVHEHKFNVVQAQQRTGEPSVSQTSASSLDFSSGVCSPDSASPGFGFKPSRGQRDDEQVPPMK